MTEYKKLSLREAVERIEPTELLKDLISGKTQSEGIFIQESMTESHQTSQGFESIPRNAWIHYTPNWEKNSISIAVDLNHEGSENLQQAYANIYILSKLSAPKVSSPKRVHEHHEIIGKVYLRIRAEKESNPTSTAVWNYFKKNNDDIDGVISMSYDSIKFISSKDKEKEITRDSFDNIVSDYRTGTKQII